MTRRGYCLALQRPASLAAIDDRCFTSHSARVGAGPDLVAKAHTTAAIKHHGRLKSETMPARYAEGVQAEMMAADLFGRLRRYDRVCHEGYPIQRPSLRQNDIAPEEIPRAPRQRAVAGHRL